jgi:two-component sensor histidine kinase
MFVARSRDPDRLVGRPAGPDLLPRLLAEREGALETTSRDGVPVLVAFSRIGPFGWTAAVNVPLAELAAPAWRSAVRTLVSGLVFLGAGLGLALVVAQRITGPIASLGDLASAPDRERGPPAAAETGLAEVDKVAEALVSGARERRAAEAALRESEFRLRLALDASQLGTWLWEAGGGLSGDARCKALFGLPPEAPVDYAVWAAAIEPEDRPAAEADAARALDAADPHDGFDREYRVRRADDGRLVWLHAVGRATFEPDPARPAGRRAARIHGTILDVTERRAAEERQALLMREVDHRAKNALAVALSLVRLAPRDDAARFAAGVEGRIAAMARAHSLLAKERWNGADLRALAAGELAAHAGRVGLEGPPARLSADAAQSVAMLLHELATNAAKHGALSAPAGRVALSWDFGHPAAEAGLRLRWAETDGPAVAGPPDRGGFGSRLLVSLTERQLGGRLALDWGPDGLRATVALPPRHAWPAAVAAARPSSAGRAAAAALEMAGARAGRGRRP